MILTQQRFQVRGAQFDLPAVGPQQPRRTLPQRRRARLLGRHHLLLFYSRQVIEQTGRRFVMKFGFAHGAKHASHRIIWRDWRKTLTLSVGLGGEVGEYLSRVGGDAFLVAP